MPPGAYEVRVGQLPRNVELGHASAQVDDRDLENLTIQLLPPRTLAAKITIEGDKAPDVSKLQISISLDDDTVRLLVPQQDGSFDFEQLGVGRYRVNVRGRRDEDVYLKTVRFGNAESPDGFFTLTEAAGGDLELVLSTRGARVTGTVQQSSGATANRTSEVVLIPDTNDIEKRESLSRHEAVDQNGAFSIHAIPPGSYLAYAAEDIPADAWSDPDFLQEVAGKAVKLRLAEGETRNLDIPVLSKASLAPVLSRLGIE